MKIKRTLNDMFELMDKAIKDENSDWEVGLELSPAEVHDIEQERFEWDKEAFIKALCDECNAKMVYKGYPLLSDKERNHIVDEVFMYDNGSLVRHWVSIAENMMNGKIVELINEKLSEIRDATFEVNFNVVIPCSVIIRANNEEQAKNYVGNLSYEEIIKAIASYKTDAKVENITSAETSEYWGENVDFDLSDK